MPNYLYILIILTFGLSADIRVNVYPDTIFVGSQVIISINVDNLSNDEIVLFHDLQEESDNYLFIDKILTENSARYTLQFWNSGNIIIPPFIIDIKKYNQNIVQIKTEELKLEILSNISNGNISLRAIKPMRPIELTSFILILIYIIFALGGLIMIAFLWNRRVGRKTTSYSQGGYCKSELNDTLKAIANIPLPQIINSQSTELFYVQLSTISRRFIKEQFYIKATEMTSNELVEYFMQMGIDNNLVDSWRNLSSKADMAKYAKYIPPIDQYHEDKLNYINLIKSFNQINKY